MTTRPLNIKRCYDVAFSPCEYVVATVARDVSLWDVATRKKRWFVHPQYNSSQLAFSPDGSLLAVKNVLGEIVILEAATGEVVRDFRNWNEGEGATPCFTKDGRHLINGTGGGQVSLRDVKTGRIENQYLLRRPRHRIGQIVRNADDDGFAVFHTKIGIETTVEPATPGEEPETVWHPPENFLSVWENGFASEPTATIKLNLRAECFAVLADGSCVVGEDSTLLRYDRNGCEQMTDMGDSEDVEIIVTDPGQQTMAVGTSSRVCLIDIASGRRLDVFDDSCQGISFSGDSKYIAIGADANSLVIPTPPFSQET